MATFTGIKHFSAKEFVGREEEVKAANQTLFNYLDRLRDLIGEPIYPSPVKGALARFEGDIHTQHYAVDRLSTAIDIFVAGDQYRNYRIITGCGLFTGVGIYFDTFYNNTSWPMFHVDLRPEQWTKLWMREDGNYIYPDSSVESATKYWAAIAALKVKAPLDPVGRR